VLAELITHSIPSIIILFSLATAENPVPVNFTGVFPVTVPNLGSIALSSGV